MVGGWGFMVGAVTLIQINRLESTNKEFIIGLGYYKIQGSQGLLGHSRDVSRFYRPAFSTVCLFEETG